METTNAFQAPCEMPVVGRMAPTPSADMHVGNIFSCLVAWLCARSANGRIVLRIEDLDEARCSQAHADSIMRDLETLGLFWDNAEVVYQSKRREAYDKAFAMLDAEQRVYPCFCSRADLHAASAPHVGERYLYQGTCRELSPDEIAERATKRKPAMRLRVENHRIEIDDLIQGRYVQNLETECGDFIIRRSDGVYSYQLAVVVDDLYQGVNQVVRGLDLLDSAPQQSYLRELITPDSPTISYAHVPLLVDEQGRRLSKRNHDQSLQGMLEHFKSVEHFIGRVAYLTGLIEREEPLTAADLVDEFNPEKLAGKRVIAWSLPE